MQRGCKGLCSVDVSPRCPPGRKTCRQETLGYSSGHGGYGGVVWVESERGGEGAGDREARGGTGGCVGCVCVCGVCEGEVCVECRSRRRLGAVLMMSSSWSEMETAAASVRVGRRSRLRLGAVLIKPLSRSEMLPAPVDVRFGRSSRRCLGKDFEPSRARTPMALTASSFRVELLSHLLLEAVPGGFASGLRQLPGAGCAAC